MPLSRLLILAIAFGLMIWFFVLPSLNDPVTRGSVGGARRSGVSRPRGTRPLDQGGKGDLA